MFTVVHVDVIQAMEFLQNIEGERAGHAKGEVVDEHSISEAVRARSLCLLQLLWVRQVLYIQFAHLHLFK